MRFSIIIPAYNAERELAGSVASVQAQTFSDWEIVLVDDGSTDGTQALCARLSQTCGKLRVLRQENRGQLLARQAGIAAAGGDYCVFLDADDALLPECLQTLHEALRRNDEPDMAIYSFYYEEAHGERRPAAPLFETERCFSGEEKQTLYRCFLTGTGLNNVWTKAVKRTVFDGDFPDYAAFAGLRCGEDRLHAMGMATNAARIVYLPAPLIRYRLLPGSVTRRYTPEDAARFNTAALYPCELDYLRQWKLLSAETVSLLRAQYEAQAVSTFNRFYQNLPTDEARAWMPAFPWRTFLPAGCETDYLTNPHLNDVQKKILTMMLTGDARGLRKHFRRKQTRKKLRTLKQKLLS